MNRGKGVSNSCRCVGGVVRVPELGKGAKRSTGLEGDESTRVALPPVAAGAEDRGGCRVMGEEQA